MVKKENSNVTNKSKSFSAGCGVEMAGIKCVERDCCQAKRQSIHRRTLILINLWVNAAFRVCGGDIKWVGTIILTPVAGIYENQLETLSLSGC